MTSPIRSWRDVLVACVVLFFGICPDLLSGEVDLVVWEHEETGRRAVDRVPPRIQYARPIQTDGGFLGFYIVTDGVPDPLGLRTLVNAYGSETGWSAAGIDYVSEGKNQYAYIRRGNEWNWTPQGEVRAFVASNAMYVIYPTVRVPQTFQWRVETLDARRSVAHRYPERGLSQALKSALRQPPASIGGAASDAEMWLLQAALPRTLSLRLTNDYIGLDWQEDDGDLAFPSVTYAGLPAPDDAWRHDKTGSAELVLEIMDAETGLRRLLRPESKARAGDMTRWSGRLDDDTEWDLFVRAPSERELDVIGAVRSDRERCLVVSVGVRYPRGEWVWHDDPVDSRTVGAGRYAHTVSSPYGFFQQRSYYPFGVLSSASAVIVAETNGREPRQFVIEAESGKHILFVRYDIATTPHTTRFPGYATFHARFRVEPGYSEDPFRVAVRSWYEHDPAWRTYRGSKHGILLPFSDVSTIRRAEDFGFAFFEKVGPLGKDVDAAYACGLKTFLYTEPWLYWHPIPHQGHWTLRSALQRMRETAGGRAGKEKDFAVAALLGASRTQEGEHRMTFLDTPWNKGARMEVVTDPELPTTDQWTVNRAMAEWRQLEEPLADPRVSGVFLDSMSKMETIDYNTNAIATASYPCTYTAGELRPGLAMPIQAVEYTSALAEVLRRRNKLIAANFPSWQYPFFMPYIDVPGEEASWYEGHRFVPAPDAELMFRRVISGNKPFFYLLATYFDLLTVEDVEQFFRLCMFYAFMPSAFSHDGAGDAYWDNSARYERDRPLFMRYVPAIQRLSAAGWEPVPIVTAEHPRIRVEQFGDATNDVFYATVMNTKQQGVETRLRVPARAGSRLAYDLLSGRSLFLRGNRELDILASPGDVTAWAFIRPARIREEAAEARRSLADEYRIAAMNLEMIDREWKAGFVCALQQQGLVPEGERPALTLDVSSERGAERTELYWPGQPRPVAILEPGQSVSIRVPGSSVELRDGWLTVRWRLETAGTELASGRIVRPAIRELFTVEGPEGRIQATNTIMSLQYAIRSRSAGPRSLIAEWEIDGRVRQTAIELGADEQYLQRIEVPAETQAARRFVFRILKHGQVLHETLGHVVYTPMVHHLGQSEGTRIVADSVYTGYTPETLRNGIVEPSGLPWYEAAFATAENEDVHWVRYVFPSPELVRSMTVYWHREHDITYTSRRGEVRAVMADGSTRVLASFTNDAPTSTTRLVFSPVSVRSIELYQPPQSGPPERSGLLWITELVVE